MALLRSFKTCSLLAAELRCCQLLPPIHQSLQVLGSQSSKSFQTGSKDFRIFHRRPLRINPAKKDEGKMLLGDYVDNSDGSTNTEVLQETRRLAKVMKSAARGDVYAGVQGISEEEDVLLKNDFKKGQVLHPSKDAGDKRGIQQNPDEEKALKSVKYVHLHDARPEFRSLLSQCGSRKLRHRHDVVLLEGYKLIREALGADLLPVAVVYSRKNLLLKILPEAMGLPEKVERLNSINIFSMPYNKMKVWSTVVTGQGVMGVFRLSDLTLAHKLRKHDSERQFSKPLLPLRRHVTLLLDSVREPGNVGALVRTAAAAGVDRVVLTKGCCDPWESKALRAGCGGHLGLEICERVSWSRIYTVVARYPTVYLADVGNSDREPLRDEEDGEDCNLDNPASMNTRLQREQAMKNVFKSSGSRQRSEERRADELDEDAGESSSEESEDFFGTYVEVQEDGSELLIDNSFLDTEHLAQFAHAKFPVKLINEVEFFSRETWQSQDIVLVVGGETGLSAHAKKFAQDNFGGQVSIPLHNGVDSLNTSVASGVILYEMWNQLQKAQMLSEQRTDGHVQGAASE